MGGFRPGVPPESKAVVALAAGDHRTAAELFADAVEAWVGGLLPLAIRARWGRGGVVAADLDSAVDALVDAEQRASGRHDPVGRSHRRSLRGCGVRTPVAVADHSTPLSARERRVSRPREAGSQ